MKKLDLIIKENPEYEALLADKSLERKTAYDNWKENLPPQDKEDYLKVFGE